MPGSDRNVSENGKHLPLSEVLAGQLGERARDDPAPEWESRVKEALLQRPRFSVKTRIVVFFSILFLAAAGVSTSSWLILSEVESSSQLVSVAGVVANEIQQARRYEKNFFLYASDLSLLSEHLTKAEDLLTQTAGEIGSVVGNQKIATLRENVAQYQELVHTLSEQQGKPGFRESAEFHELEAAMRDHGANMISLALDVVTKERLHISSLIAFTKRASIVLLVCLLPLFLLVALLTSRHIIVRLNRLMNATQGIAEGDFSLLLPQRKYRDEFSNLAVALNHMMQELVKRQTILVESHKMRAIGNLTAGVAHELNNPLNNIMLTAEILDEDFDDLNDSQRKEMIRDIVTQADRGRDVVKNLLDFARESKAKVEHLPVSEFLEDTTRLTANQIRMHKVKLSMEVADGLPPIYGDRRLLQQVFLNLILNAIDAMPNGGHLSIRALREEATGFISIELIDTGSGIPKHLLHTVFDPFFTTKPPGKGTGLGLAVSQGIVSNHGGEIEVRSTMGEGTTFTVHLPSAYVPAQFTTNEASLPSSTQLTQQEGPTSTSR